MLLSLALPLALAGAQEEEAVEFNGFYTLSAASGVLVDNGDDTYLLVLESVPAFAPWVTTVESGGMFAGRDTTVRLTGNWAAVPDGLEGSAVMETDGNTLWLTLSEPVYDVELGTLSFSAVIDTIYAAEESKEGPQVPASFGLTTLFIKTNYDFEAALLLGFEARSLETRDLTSGGGNNNNSGAGYNN
jgi:hypothetical protein